MNFFVDNWYLFAVAIVSGALLVWPLLKAGSAGPGVTTAEAVRLINREKAVMIDVSDASEYAAAHVAGARSVPLSRLATATAELPKNKALPLVVTGNGAAKAVAILKKLGFENSRALIGGLAAWRAANLPVDKSA
ncbi:rhodanese-like domain-containing protein [soil metagenome]